MWMQLSIDLYYSITFSCRFMHYDLVSLMKPFIAIYKRNIYEIRCFWICELFSIWNPIFVICSRSIAFMLSKSHCPKKIKPIQDINFLYVCFILFVVDLLFSCRVAPIIPSFLTDNSRHVSIWEHDGRIGSPSSSKPHFPTSIYLTIYERKSCMFIFWLPCMSCDRSANPWSILFCYRINRTILLAISYCYGYVLECSTMCSISNLIEWSSIAKYEIYGPLDKTIFEKMSSFLI